MNYESELKALFPAGEVKASEPRHFWVQVGAGELLDAVKALRTKLGITHLSTIVGEDLRDHFLLSYPFAAPQVVIVLQVKVDRAKPEVPSLAPILDGAIVYEREIHDILGIVPLGHPDLRRQILPEDWPEGVYPLRKDVTLPRAKVESDGGEK
jgi:NADH-quinone oxidoreductase subunit C